MKIGTFMRFGRGRGRGLLQAAIARGIARAGKGYVNLCPPTKFSASREKFHLDKMRIFGIIVHAVCQQIEYAVVSKRS